MVKVDNIAEIYNNYMTLEDEKVKVYIDKEAKRYDVLYETIMYKIEKYVESLPEEEKRKYMLRKEALHYIHRPQSKIKTLQIKKDDLPEKDFLTELNIVKYSLKRMSPNWLIYLSNVLSLSEKDALEWIRKSQISKEAYNKYIRRFKTNFPEQVEYINYLEEIYIKYEKNNNLVEVEQEEKIEPDVINPLLIDLLSSGCCMEEYSSITGHTISELRQLFKNGKNPLELEEIQSREDSRKNLRNIVLYLIEKLITNELDIFLYYETTRLDLNEFVDIAKRMIDDNTIVRKLGLFRDKYLKIITMKINKDAELNGTKIIDGRIVDKDDKEFIINFLESSNIPIGFYNMYLKKYLNGELDINGKVKCL